MADRIKLRIETEECVYEEWHIEGWSKEESQ